MALFMDSIKNRRRASRRGYAASTPQPPRLSHLNNMDPDDEFDYGFTDDDDAHNGYFDLGTNYNNLDAKFEDYEEEAELTTRELPVALFADIYYDNSKGSGKNKGFVKNAVDAIDQKQLDEEGQGSQSSWWKKNAQNFQYKKVEDSLRALNTIESAKPGKEFYYYLNYSTKENGQEIAIKISDVKQIKEAGCKIILVLQGGRTPLEKEEEKKYLELADAVAVCDADDYNEYSQNPLTQNKIISFDPNAMKTLRAVEGFDKKNNKDLGHNLVAMTVKQLERGSYLEVSEQQEEDFQAPVQGRPHAAALTRGAIGQFDRQQPIRASAARPASASSDSSVGLGIIDSNGAGRGLGGLPVPNRSSVRRASRTTASHAAVASAGTLMPPPSGGMRAAAAATATASTATRTTTTASAPTTASAAATAGAPASTRRAPATAPKPEIDNASRRKAVRDNARNLFLFKEEKVNEAKDVVKLSDITPIQNFGKENVKATSILAQSIKNWATKSTEDARTIITPLILTKGGILGEAFELLGAKPKTAHESKEPSGATKDRIYISDEMVSFVPTAQKDLEKTIKDIQLGSNTAILINGAEVPLPPPGLQFATLSGLCLAGNIFGKAGDLAPNLRGLNFVNCQLGTWEKPLDLSGIPKDMLDTMQFHGCDMKYVKVPENYVWRTSALIHKKTVNGETTYIRSEVAIDKVATKDQGDITHTVENIAEYNKPSSYFEKMILNTSGVPKKVSEIDGVDLSMKRLMPSSIVESPSASVLNAPNLAASASEAHK